MAAGVIWRQLRAKDLSASGRGRPVILAPPIGSHSALAELIAARAETACAARGWPARRTTLVLVGHGTTGDPESGATLHAQAERLAASGRFSAVRPAFLEQTPRLDQVAAALGDNLCVAVGFLADEGRHGRIDVPALLGPGHHYAGPIGLDPGIPDLIATIATN